MLRQTAIRRKTIFNMLYRLDFRGPEIILSEGFKGSNNLWMNNIFGENTIFCAKSLKGISRFFLESVMNKSCDGNLKKKGGLVSDSERALYPADSQCFVYQIQSHGMEVVDVKQDISGLFKGESPMCSHMFRHVTQNSMQVNKRSIDEIYIDALEKLESYYEKCAQFTEEVIVHGPVHPRKISLYKVL